MLFYGEKWRSNFGAEVIRMSRKNEKNPPKKKRGKILTGGGDTGRLEKGESRTKGGTSRFVFELINR